MADLLPVLKQKFFNTNGAPLAGGKLYSYEAGTSTPVATFTDQSGLAANTNPIILNANGEADVWIKSGAYKFVLTDSLGAIQWTVDNVQSSSSSSSGTTTNQSTGINYILNPNAETNVSGWTTYANVAQSSPTSGTGGTPNSTWTRITTNPLRGAGSFLFTHNLGASRQGEGVSYAFNIDPSDKAKALQISFDYMVASGTFVAGSPAVDSDLTVWIFDITNNQLIQPSSYKLFSNSQTTSDKYTAYFQTNPNSTSYRLIIHCGTTSTSAFTAMFDNFNVGPSVYVYGIPVTDPVAYTPTFTGFGTVSTQNVSSWRDGAYLFGEGTFTAGTTTATQAQITMGYGGYNAVATSLSTLSSSLVAVGKWTSSTNNQSGVILAGPSRNYLVLGLESSSTNGMAPINGSSITTGSIISFNFRVPIQGWSSSVQMSDQADTRVVDWVGYVSANQAVTANVTDIPLTSRKDSHGGWSGSSYVVKVPGDYIVTSVSSPTTAVSYYVQAYVNGTLTRSVSSSAGGANACGATVLNDLKVGDVVSFRSGVTLTVSLDTNSSFTLTRISGPTTIAASENISAKYYVTLGASATANTPINYDFKEYDSHGCVTTGVGTWKFTAPTNGVYDILGAHSSGGNPNLKLWKNGSSYQFLAGMPSASVVTSFCTSIRLVAGDYIDVRMDGTQTLNGGVIGSYQAYICINKRPGTQ